MPPPRKVKYSNGLGGFTLAEVLITLGIIGVVAALTLPVLINKTQNEQLKTALKKGYSVLQQAVLQMNYDNGGPVTENYIATRTFKYEFTKYFKIIRDCADGSSYDIDACVPNNSSGSSVYKNYTNNSNIRLTLLDDGQFIIADGMNMFLENNDTNYILISIDVNGYKKKPNKWGHDLFTFQLMYDGKLLPMGADGTLFDKETYCSKTGKSDLNGIACTSTALSDKNYWSSL